MRWGKGVSEAFRPFSNLSTLDESLFLLSLVLLLIWQLYWLMRISG